MKLRFSKTINGKEVTAKAYNEAYLEAYLEEYKEVYGNAYTAIYDTYADDSAYSSAEADTYAKAEANNYAEAEADKYAESEAALFADSKLAEGFKADAIKYIGKDRIKTLTAKEVRVILNSGFNDKGMPLDNSELYKVEGQKTWIMQSEQGVLFLEVKNK